MALYFYFNETTGDLVYSDQATYSGDGYTSLGQQTNINPTLAANWIFNSKRANIKTVTKDPNISAQIDILNKMSSMFNGCSALTSLDLGGFDTANVTDMSNMFRDCNALTSLDLGGFDTANVTNMSNMFNDCSALISLDLGGFDTSNATSMGGMFYDCSALTSLDLGDFDTSNVTSMSSMFYGCGSLRIIDISLNMSNVSSELPAATYYDAVTRQSYAKASIPGGSTYVRDLADLDLIATMVQTRLGINKVERMLNTKIQSIRDNLSFVSEDRVRRMYIKTSGISDSIAVGDYSSISYAPASGVFRHSGELLKLTGAIPWDYTEVIEGAFSLEFNIGAVLGGKQIDADVPGSSNISFPVLLCKGDIKSTIPENTYPGVCVCTPTTLKGEIYCNMFFNVPTIRSGESMVIYF